MELSAAELASLETRIVEARLKAIVASATAVLTWRPLSAYAYEAVIGNPGDCVTFSLMDYPTCYRRGRFRLLVEVCEGPNHTKWGCFDEQDQPVRYYHDLTCALREADMLADVLLTDRRKSGKA
jgi:hypothetical protein